MGVLEARVGDPVEEILQGAAHVAEVLRGAQDHGLSREHILGAGLEGAERAHLDVLDLGHGGAGQHRLAQAARVLRGRMGDDQQAASGHVLICRFRGGGSRQ